jgi:hypothetical protein
MRSTGAHFDRLFGSVKTALNPRHLLGAHVSYDHWFYGAGVCANRFRK